MNFIIGSFFINLVIGVGALMFTLRSNEAYFRSLGSVVESKKVMEIDL